jgi:hypothetical protein
MIPVGGTIVQSALASPFIVASGCFALRRLSL